MPRIRCFYADCIFIDDGFCGAASVELDPDTGCTTYKQAGVAIEDDEEWEEELDEEWEDEDLEDEDDFWLEDEDEDEF